MIKKYKESPSGSIVEALQYGRPGEWVTFASQNIAQFVLGWDELDSRVTVENERMLDVAMPIHKEWRPEFGVAPLDIVEPGTGFIFRVNLGDWVIRHSDKSIGVCKAEFFSANYKEYHPEPPRTEHDELSDIIYASFSTLEGELYQALAETAASAVLRAGWSRKK